MDAKKYIKHQISLFDRQADSKQTQANLNVIYAVLESRGFNRYEIGQLVQEVILENLHELKLKLQMEGL